MDNSVHEERVEHSSRSRDNDNSSSGSHSHHRSNGHCPLVQKTTFIRIGNGQTTSSAELERAKKDTTGSDFHYDKSFKGHKRDITVLKFSPCGNWLASGAEDRLIRIWSVKEGQLCKELSGHKSGVNDIAWHDEVTMLASAGDDCSVKLWDLNLEDGYHNEVIVNKFTSLKEHKDTVLCLAFKNCYIENNYVHMVASGSHDRRIIIWDAETKKIRHKLCGHDQPITAVDFNINGSLLLSSSYDGTVRIWDTHIGVHIFTVVSKRDPVIFARFIRENDWFVQMAMLNSTIELWDFQNCDRKLVNKYEGHMNTQYPIMSNTVYGKYIVSASEDGLIYVWPISGGEPKKLSLKKTVGPIIAFDVHPHLPLIASSHRSKKDERDNHFRRMVDFWTSDLLKN